MSQKPQLILASQSPRRRQLLAQIGFSAGVQPSHIDETPRTGEPPAEYVLRMAREKAAACPAAGRHDAVVLAADTAVVLDGKILGKPATRREAADMLRGLSGRAHQVMTAIALVWEGRARQQVVVSDVHFAALNEEQINRYLDSGEADDKAGAYGIQGRAATFVSHLSGSYSAVVGLPLFEVAQLLREWGVEEESRYE